MNKMVLFKTLCPYCLTKVEASICEREGKAFLKKTCVEHGSLEKLLSHHGKFYMELENFRLRVAKQICFENTRKTNYSVLSINSCQLDCDYCHVRVPAMAFESMNSDDLDSVLRMIKDNKEQTMLFLSGGEPTLHPDLFYFLEQAKLLGIPAGIATNGLKLLDENFYRKLKASPAKEIILSYEVLEEKKVKNETQKLKLKALQKLEKDEGRFSLVLAPLIFREKNEQLILDTLNYAKDRHFVKRIEVNGFSWVGSGIKRDIEQMIMPDEMMDVIASMVNVDDREDIFIFQKIFFMGLGIFWKVHVCRFFQFMFLVREKGELTSITTYFDMKRIEKGLAFWERFSGSFRVVQIVIFFWMMLLGVRFKTFVLLKKIFKTGLDKLRRKVPVTFDFLPVAIVTNCSAITTDIDICSKWCANGIIYKKAGKLFKVPSMYPFF